jgi:hypothetical protein
VPFKPGLAAELAGEDSSKLRKYALVLTVTRKDPTFVVTKSAGATEAVTTVITKVV